MSDTPNRQVHHVYPVKSAQVPPEHLNADGTRRAHIITAQRDKMPEDCWCGPTVMEWAEKPNGRMGWVIVKEGNALPAKED